MKYHTEGGIFLVSFCSPCPFIAPFLLISSCTGIKSTRTAGAKCQHLGMCGGLRRLINHQPIPSQDEIKNTDSSCMYCLRCGVDALLRVSVRPLYSTPQVFHSLELVGLHTTHIVVRKRQLHVILASDEPAVCRTCLQMLSRTPVLVIFSQGASAGVRKRIHADALPSCYCFSLRCAAFSLLFLSA